MSIKTILVALEGNERGSAALTVGLQAARACDAHLDVLHVRADPRDVFPFMAEPISAGSLELVIEAAEKGAAERAQRARGQFDAFCKANDVTVSETPAAGGVAASWHEETGAAGEVVARRGRLADLIVVPRPAEETPAPVVLETALLETGRAILTAPPEPGAEFGRNVVVAWNGSAQAARAVASALPLLAAAAKVSVLTASPKDETVASPADVAGYLAVHGISASTANVTADADDAGEALLAETAKIGADLLVMGGYGHSRVREVILGGVTYHVLANAPIPVLMAH